MKKFMTGVSLLLLAATTYYFFPEQRLPRDREIDKIIVTKSERIMEIYSAGEVIKTYTVSLGKNPIGDKQFEGDKRTPEGKYEINDKNPNSAFYKNLGLSYPNDADVQQAKLKNLNAGGQIKIHGLKNGLGFIGKFHRWMNWTAGCIALTNLEMDELYDRVKIGTPIIIKP